MNILEARRRTLGANVYKKTVQGNPVSVRSLARMQPGLKVFGRSEQFTTTGAQLIPFELDAEMTSEDGVAKCVPQKDGFRIELNGTSTQTARSDIRFVGGVNYLEEDSYDEYENLPAGTYYAKISDNRFILNVIAWRGTNITLIATSTGGSFEVQDGDKFRIFIRPSLKAVSGTVQAIISKQDDSVMYEPYTGGKPSPSVDYPQEITSAGDDGNIQVDVTGAQLADISQATNHAGSDYIQVFDTGFEFTYDEQKVNSRLVSVPCVLKSGESYILTAERSSQKIYSYLPETNQFLGWNKNFVPAQNITRISVYVNQGDPSGTYKVENLMLNEGSTALPYEPYKTPQSLTVQTPNGLPGIPVTSGGNYADENGQQWICDEIDFRRGKYVQRVAWVTFDGSDDEVWTYEESNTYSRGFVQIPGCSRKKRNPVICNRRTYSDNISRDTVNSIFSNAGLIYVCGEKTSLATDAEWRQELSEKPVTVLYELETPIETDLTEEQMATYTNLHTNRPTTVVSATDGAGLELTYKTKKSLEVTA